MMTPQDHEKQIKALTSTNKDEHDSAWTDLLQDLVPRIERRVKWRLCDTPDHVRQRVDDIRGDVMAKLTEKVYDGRVVSTVTHFALGIADNLCMKAKDRGRDRIPTIGSQLDRNQGPQPTPSTIATSQEIRAGIRTGLLKFQNDIAREVREDERSGDANAPVLQLLAIDLITRGYPRPRHLIDVLDLENHTATRLRQNALERLGCFFTDLASSSIVEPAAHVAQENLIEGTPIAELWFENSVGCVAITGLLDDSRPSHHKDIAIAKDLHEKSCPGCSPSHNLPSDAKIKEWQEAAERSRPLR